MLHKILKILKNKKTSKTVWKNRFYVTNLET